jgi:hypothetical protein
VQRLNYYEKKKRLPMNKWKFIPGIILACALITSCEEMWNHCTEGNGHTSTDTRTLPAFSQIEVNGDFKVRVDTDAITVAIVKADDNLQDLIQTYVVGDKLVIESRHGDCLNSSHPIEISVTAPTVNNIELNGSGRVYCYGLNVDALILKLSGSGEMDLTQIKAGSATLDLEGSGNIDFSADVENILSRIEGSGDITINGTAISSEFRVIGSGHVRAGGINTDVCTAYISGSGVIDTDVNNSLDVTIIGSGVVNYFGNPVITSNISGSGKIVKQ